VKALLLLLAACQYETPAVSIGTADAPVDTAGPQTATLFLADFTADRLYRYALTPDDPAPLPELVQQLDGALTPLVLPDGQLLVGNVNQPQLTRFADAFADPLVEATPIANNGLQANQGQLVVIADELWVPLASGGSLDRLRLDASGNAQMIGSVTVPTPRGLAFNPDGAHVYATDCCTINFLHHFQIDGTGKATEKVGTNFSLSNPHAVIVLPWGELLVANAGGNTLSRFSLDTAGNPTFIDFTGGLAQPIGIVLTPWDELYVSNGAGFIARFTFDANHKPVLRDTFDIPDALTPVWMFLVPR
jgi:hypothetical protein